MSLISQLEAFVAEGKIAKASKPQKRKAKKPVNPNIAKKYQRPGLRLLPGERFRFQEYKAPPIPKPTMYNDNRRIVEGKFVTIRPISYQEQYGHKTAIVLAPDDVEVITEVCAALQKQHMTLKEAVQYIKATLKDALHVNGCNLAILKDK